MFVLFYQPLGSPLWKMIDTIVLEKDAIKTWHKMKDQEPTLPLILVDLSDNIILPEKLVA